MIGPNPILALLIDLALGLWIIRFARKAYSNPDGTLQGWYSYLPLKRWARGLLRGFCILWIVGAILIVLNGMSGVLPILNNHRYDDSLVLVFVGCAIVGTAFVVPRQRSALE